MYERTLNGVSVLMPYQLICVIIISCFFSLHVGDLSSSTSYALPLPSCSLLRVVLAVYHQSSAIHPRYVFIQTLLMTSTTQLSCDVYHRALSRLYISFKFSFMSLELVFQFWMFAIYLTVLWLILALRYLLPHKIIHTDCPANLFITCTFSLYFSCPELSKAK